MKLRGHFLTFFTCISSLLIGQTGTTTSGSFTVNDIERTYTFYVPAMYNETSAIPIVFNLHGLSGTSETQEGYQDFRKIADTANFIIIHPEGENQNTFGIGPDAPGWGTLFSGFASMSAGAPDREFILRLLDTMRVNYNINGNKVYSTGYSQGGFLSHHLASLNNDKFTAIASVAGSLAFEYKDAATLTHPTPVMVIHGTADATISYTGDGSTFMDADSLVHYWALYNGCDTSSSAVTETNLPDISTADNCQAVHFVYSGGTNGSTVEFYKIVNGDHTVPSEETPDADYGVGDRNQDMTAAKEIWRFFSQYDLVSLGGTDQNINNPYDPNNPNNPNTGIEDSELSLINVKLSPNPSNGTFMVNIEDFQGASINITNILGANIFKSKLSNLQTSITLDNASSGVYFYQIFNSKAIISTGKIVVE